MLTIHLLKTLNGKEPYSEWIETLDVVAQAKIYAYIARMALGGSKNHVEPVGEGVFEIRINYGPGYRVYFGRRKHHLVLILGGDKNSQHRDIAEAKKFWRRYA